MTDTSPPEKLVDHWRQPRRLVAQSPVPGAGDEAQLAAGDPRAFPYATSGTA